MAPFTLELSQPALLAVAVALACGVGAGAVTTVAGFGGGMLLGLALAAWIGPAAALVVAAPALALGHVHRTYLYRDDVDLPVAKRFALGAVPGALVGGVMAAAVPEWILGVALALGAGLAVLHGLGWMPRTLGRRALVPGAAGVGLLAASCGGGGVLLPPTLMSAGLGGRRFVATAAVGALVIQAVRIAAYGATGMVAAWHVPFMVGVAAGALVGNLLGQRIAARLDEGQSLRVTQATLALAVVLGVINLVSLSA